MGGNRRNSFGFGDQQMNMWMVRRLCGPCVENHEDAGHRAEMSRVIRQFHDHSGHRLHEKSVHVLLIGQECVVQFLGDGRHEMIVVARQKFGLATLQPLACLWPVTLRTGSVAAAVKHPEPLIAVSAAITMSTQLGRRTGRDVPKCFSLGRHDLVAELREVLNLEATDHVRQFDRRVLHDSPPLKRVP